MRKLLIALIAVVPCFATQAQNFYKLTFKGSASGVTSAGQEFTQSLNNKTLISEWATRAGVSDQKNLILAYHANSDGHGGDTIEAINKKDGSSAVTIFLMASPESAGVETAKGVTEKKFLYVYNIYQPGFSMGTMVLNEKTSVDKHGQTNKLVIDGDIMWCWTSGQGTNSLRIGSGKFNVGGKPLTFKAK